MTAGRLIPGTILSNGRFQIEQLIAAGGMGAVYKALDLNFKRPCAVKEMLDKFHNESDHARAVEWFTREAGLLLDLNHPCIPRVRDFFAENGRHYLVMDLIQGRTLSEVLAQGGLVVGVNGVSGVTEMRARLWAQQLCSVLAYLHSQDPPIIFRDLKPSNVMVTAKDEIKLIDFGIARQFQEQQQATVVMTLGYAPPEQLHGRPEPRSDLYALGATIFRVLTQRDASHNQPNAFSFPLVRTLRPDVSLAFEQFLRRALEPDIDRRWGSAAEMERALLSLPPLEATATYIATNMATVVTPPVPSVSAEPPQTPAYPAQPAREHSSAPAGPALPASSALPISALADSASDGPISHASGEQLFAVPVASTPEHLTPVLSGSDVHNSDVHSGGTGGTGGNTGERFLADARRFLAEHNIELAYEAVSRAHTLEPQNAIVHQIFGQVFAQRKPPQIDLALNAYEHSLQLLPNDARIQAETQRLIGDVWYFLRMDPGRAIPAYRQSLLLQEGSFETYELLGQCYEKTNALSQAVDAYSEAVRLAAAQPPIVRLRLNFALGLLGWRVQQFAIAERAFVQVLVLNTADYQARHLLSQIYEREGKLEDAWRECNYVINGPLRNNPGVQQQYFRLKQLLGQ